MDLGFTNLSSEAFLAHTLEQWPESQTRRSVMEDHARSRQRICLRVRIIPSHALPRSRSCIATGLAVQHLDPILNEKIHRGLGQPARRLSALSSRSKTKSDWYTFTPTPVIPTRLKERIMSIQSEARRITAPEIRARKGGQPIASLTSYHAHTAQLLDRHLDMILVGDSLGMVMHGLETTVPVTVEMMIVHGRAVVRGTRHALIIVDLPFGSYEASPVEAFHTAARVLKETGAGAVKLEGGLRMAETVRFLVERGVPVMGHVGLTPQAINTLGSFKARGRDDAEAAGIMDDARAISEAGAFAVVLEAIAEPLARRITEEVGAPTIGIGGSAACDGQILVLEDMLGLSPRVPKFVKKFADLGPAIEEAVGRYAEEVRARVFPGPAHVYGLKAPKAP